MSRYGKINRCHGRTKKFAIDALITLVVEELIQDLHLEPAAILTSFVASKTGALLYDESSKLWWNGLSYIADMYKNEQTKLETTPLSVHIIS